MRQINIYVIDYYERYQLKRIYDKMCDARINIQYNGIKPFMVFPMVEKTRDFNEFIETNKKAVNYLVSANYIDEPIIVDEKTQIRYLIVYEDVVNKRVRDREAILYHKEVIEEDVSN